MRDGIVALRKRLQIGQFAAWPRVAVSEIDAEEKGDAHNLASRDL